MRKIVQIELDPARKILLAVCEDGTLWRGLLDTSTEDPDPQWRQLFSPPEGNYLRHEPTLEEQAEKLREAGGRALIVGKGLSGEK